MDPFGGYDDRAFVAEFYDFVPPYRDRPDVPFYVQAAREASGTVLEVGCGTGRVLVPVARAGIEVCGLDGSSSMLAVCREKVAREPEDVQERVTLARGDMRSFNLRRQFALIALPFRPFQHLLSVDDQRACLACLHKHLESGGQLILDLFNPSLHRLIEPVGLVGEEPEFTLPDGRRVRRSYRVVERDWFDQILDVEFTYQVEHADGAVEQLFHRTRLRYLFRFEAEHLLARSGFQVTQVFAGYDRSPYGSVYPGDLIFTAVKP